MANDGTGTGWDEAHPSSADVEGNGWKEVQDIRKGLRLRMQKEHVTPDINSVGGEHLPGSAKVYVGGSAPTLRPDGSTPLNASDAGRLWVNGTTIKEWNGAAWVTVGGGGGGGTTVLTATIQDVKANNTNGGGFTSGSWQVRDLNTTNDPNGIITVFNSNQFTLAAGTYDIRVRAPAYQVDQHQARLYNVTDSSFVGGSTEYSNSSGGFANTRSEVGTVLVLAASKVFRVEHICKTTKAFQGYGIGNSLDTGISTVFTSVRILKLA